MTSTIIPFTKMQGLGNDFVVVSASDVPVEMVGSVEKRGAAARLLCDRRLGIGADGLILLFDFIAKPELRSAFAEESTARCDVGYIYVNSDGSPSAMCGNGLRCAGLWLHNHGVAKRERYLIATQSGPKEILYKNERQITTDLDEPILESVRIPLRGIKTERLINQPLAGMAELQGTCVNVGNPHVVLFAVEPSPKLVGPVESEDPTARFPQNFAQLAPAIQALEMFPEGVNVEFAVIESRSRMRLYIWERGCGATLACASGAAAGVVAGVLEQRLERKVAVQLLGGALDIEWSEKDNHVRLTGPASVTFSGMFDLSTFCSEKISRAAEAVCQ